MNKVVETEEKDRKKFAEELHDGLGPILSTIKMYMDLIEKSAVYNPESSKNEIIRNIFDLLDENRPLLSGAVGLVCQAGRLAAEEVSIRSL